MLQWALGMAFPKLKVFSNFPKIPDRGSIHDLGPELSFNKESLVAKSVNPNDGPDLQNLNPQGKRPETWFWVRV